MRRRTCIPYSKPTNIEEFYFLTILPENCFMKIFNIAFIFIFFVFAALQYNDPDPYIWMPIYLYAAFLCYRAIHHHYPKVLYIIGLVAYTGYGIGLFFDKFGVLDWMEEHHAESLVQSMQASKPWIEETREFFGLAIVIGVLLINWFSGSKKSQRNLSLKNKQ
jgi:hypothetical protein